MECLSPNKDIKKHHLLYFPHRAPLSIQQKNYINQEKKNNGSILTEGILFSDQEKKIREKINLTLTPTLSLMVWAQFTSILRKDACLDIVNLSIRISCMCVTKLVKVILIWKTKTIKIQAVQINHRVSKVKSTINHF